MPGELRELGPAYVPDKGAVRVVSYVVTGLGDTVVRLPLVLIGYGLSPSFRERFGSDAMCAGAAAIGN
jgi:hypothetical protein